MNPLQNLQDIHTPTGIEAWPPAYGWWLLTGLIIVLIVVSARSLIRAHKKRLAKRQALKRLAQIDLTQSQSISQLNQLMKRVAMHYFAQQKVQQMFGQQWQHFLLASLPAKQAEKLEPSFAKMQQALYQQQSPESAEVQQYQQACAIWIKSALPPKAKTLKQLEQQDA